MNFQGSLLTVLASFQEFPSEKQGYLHIDTEDQAGNRNIVDAFSQSIWVDNVAPELVSVS